MTASLVYTHTRTHNERESKLSSRIGGATLSRQIAPPIGLLRYYRRYRDGHLPPLTVSAWAMRGRTHIRAHTLTHTLTHIHTYTRVLTQLVSESIHYYRAPLLDVNAVKSLHIYTCVKLCAYKYLH